ncbi:putative reverse transcriptase domain-containing protein [Tanacetum coccineum]
MQMSFLRKTFHFLGSEEHKEDIQSSSVIDSGQSAFIKGRIILDGPFILNEVLAWYRKRKKGLMIFKVDFEKAFDSLRWDYLDSVMENLRFGSKWRFWIRGCFSRARSPVLVNGSPTSKFEIFKMLRQGDPFSPFPFILAMEGLHALICKAEELGLFKGATIGWDNINVSHLMAATFPLKYLDAPVGCNMARWPSHFNLGNLPTYYMSLYMMPALVLQKLESIRNKFFIRADQCLLFKWVWRLLTYPSELWARVVINIHGSNRGIFDDHGRCSSASPWCSIMKSINNIKRKGKDNLSMCSRKIGNGAYTRECLVANWIYLSDWYSVLRRAPRGGAELALNKLPSKINLQWKGIDAGLVLCPIFQDDVESVNHLFFNCDLAKDLWDLLAKWWDLDIPVCANILEWYSWLDSLCASIKACLDSFGEHAVHCKELSGFKYRHDMVRDVLFDICRRSGISVKKEAPVNFLTDPSDGRSTLRPADILVFGWVGGKHACVDLTGVSPLVGLSSRGFTVGQTALKAASCKVTKHEKACIENQHVFIPFAFNTFGFLAPEAVELLTRVQRVMNSNVMTHRSINVVFTRIGFAIQKRASGAACCPFAFSYYVTVLICIY